MSEIFIVAVIAAVVLITYFFYKLGNKDDSDLVTPKPYGIKGFLFFIICINLWIPAYGLLMADAVFLSNEVIHKELLKSQSWEFYKSLVIAILLVSWIANIIICILLTIRKRKYSISALMYNSWINGPIIILIINALLPPLILGNAISQSNALEIMFKLAASIIWSTFITIYIYKSSRVKNTYV